ncbi:immunoglobulin alpha Fc receptor-like [Talpa occidentalis]|uniref:immunoglobulin alpha Fc receptor-like n=1 Tax=Talpa occidentalis TaxID=50954 RepID=UPI00188F5E1C|nr:immunoglobulin alpha Fc receptor-like [Talpa occidentalis]
MREAQCFKTLGVLESSHQGLGGNAHLVSSWAPPALPELSCQNHSLGGNREERRNSDLILPVDLLSVFCLGQKIQAQKGDLPLPAIFAKPSSPIPWNEPVTILCRGTNLSYLYQLDVLRNSTYTQVEKKLVLQEEAEFTINHMDASTAGRYQCRYRVKTGWSPHSRALDLVVTGSHEKPRLAPGQRLVVKLGETVPLQCCSEHSLFDGFSLTADNGRTLAPCRHDGHQSLFTLGPVDAGFSGNYSCYGWHNNTPYVWSAPSNALELVVTDYTVENLIRMGTSGLVLVALLALLAESWHSRQVPSGGDGKHQSTRTHQAAWSSEGAPTGHSGHWAPKQT